MDFSLDNLLGRIREGAAVPAVDVADLRTVLNIMADVKEPQNVGFGAQFIQASCGPDADTLAVWFRASMLQVAKKDGFLGGLCEGEPSNELLQYWAAFPSKATEVLPDGSFRLNMSELREGLRELQRN